MVNIVFDLSGVHFLIYVVFSNFLCEFFFPFHVVIILYDVFYLLHHCRKKKFKMILLRACIVGNLTACCLRARRHRCLL